MVFTEGELLCEAAAVQVQELCARGTVCPRDPSSQETVVVSNEEEFFDPEEAVSSASCSLTSETEFVQLLDGAAAGAHGFCRPCAS